MGDETGTALATALKENSSLRVFKCEATWAYHLPMAEVVLRNCQLPVHWLAAACFARHAASRACLGIPEEDFRRSIFCFFLPEGVAKRLAARAAARPSADGAPMALAEDEGGTGADEVIQHVVHTEAPAHLDEEIAALQAEAQRHV